MSRTFEGFFMKVYSAFVVAVVLMLGSVCTGQQQKLKPGAAAPGLDIEEWIQGSETTIASGKVYVVFFWESGSTKNKDAIELINDLYKEFTDDGLTVIAITNEEELKAKAMVKIMADQMTYIVAIDRRESSKRAWMDASDKKSIPMAFIIDRNGKVAFIGSPAPSDGANFEEVLRKVMAGRFDPELEEQADPLVRAARQARKMKNWRLATRHYDEIIALDPKVFAGTSIERFDMILRDMGDKAEAYTYAKSLINGQFAADAGALRMLASKIASDPQIDAANRDLDVALSAAEKAKSVAGAKDSASLATLALVYYTRGDMVKAVDFQKQAYFNANPKHKPEYNRTLKAYQEAAQRASSTTTKPSS